MTGAGPSRAPGLALLLEQGGARLVAAATGEGGVRVEACEVAVRGRPRAVGECRGAVGAVVRLAATLPHAVLEGWVAARWVGAAAGGWRVEQVRWDMSEGTGAWELRGRAGAEPVWLRAEVCVRADGGRLRVRPGRCWLLGPPGVAVGRTWAALRRRLVATGVGCAGADLVIDAGLAAIGPAFAAAGWRVPGGLRAVAVRITAAGVEVRGGDAGWPEGQVDLGRPAGQVEVGGDAGWPEGQVDLGRAAGQVEVGGDAGWPEGQVEGAGRGWPAGQVEVDVLAAERAGLWGSAAERAAACERLRALAARRPGLAGPLARARARALRFVDRDGCAAALRAWLAAEATAEGWWALAAVTRGVDVVAGLTGLARLDGLADVRAGRALGLALALGRTAGGVAAARALLEAQADAAAPAAVWRALAWLRAADPVVKPVQVEAALVRALGEDGWRRREEASDLRVRVAEAAMRSGRSETSLAALLRRVLGEPGRRGRTEAEPRPEADRLGLRGSAQIAADFYAQDGRWQELVALLERELGRLGAAARDEALARIARIRRHHLGPGVEAG